MAVIWCFKSVKIFLFVSFCVLSFLISNGTCDENNFGYSSGLELFESISNYVISPQKILPVNSENEKCAEDSRTLLKEAKSLNLDALNILDSWGKIPSGILDGNINQYGNFDQCVRTGGKYCLASLSFKIHERLDPLIYSHFAINSSISDSGHRVPRFSTVQWGFCLPLTCSSSDVEETIHEYLSNNSLISNISVKLDPRMCQSSQSKSSAMAFGMILSILIFGLVLFLCLVSTILEPILPKNNTSNELLVAFSLRRNWRILKNMDLNNTTDVSCIDGIRFMSAISLLLSHKQMALMFLPYINRTKMAELTGMAWTTVGRTAILHTDTFIFLSGFLTAKSSFRDYEKGGKMNVKHSILTRLFRLTPNLFAVIVFCTWILPTLNWGPLWPQVITTHSDLCKKYFWKNLLYIHNFYPFEEMCLTHTHQLGIDMQLYLFSFVLLFLLWNFQKFGLMVLIIIASISTYLRYMTTITLNLSSIVHFGIPISRLMKTADYSYIRPSHRITVYIMGILVSHFLHFRKHELILSKVQVIVGWIVFLSFGILTVIGPYSTGMIDYVYNPSDAAIYSSFAPILWSSFVAWGLITARYGYAGWFGKFLSWKGFKIFTRISYAVYLTQFPIFFYNVGITRTASSYSSFDVFNVGELACIFTASCLLTLMFDLPFQNVQKVLWPKRIKGPENHVNNDVIVNDAVQPEAVPGILESDELRQRRARFHG